MFHLKNSRWLWLDLNDASQGQTDETIEQTFLTYNFYLKHFSVKLIYFLRFFRISILTLYIGITLMSLRFLVLYSYYLVEPPKCHPTEIEHNILYYIIIIVYIVIRLFNAFGIEYNNLQLHLYAIGKKLSEIDFIYGILCKKNFSLIWILCFI